jgi:uncharacterized UPF0146 family protein
VKKKQKKTNVVELGIGVLTNIKPKKKKKGVKW